MSAGDFFPDVSLTKCGITGPVPGRALRGHGIDSDGPVFILRPADVLRRALAGFNGAPLLSTHTRTLGVNSRHWQRHVVGATGSHAKFDEPYVVNALSIWKPRALATAHQISVGFRSQIQKVRGRSHDAVVCDAQVDHVALVPRGLLGLDCSLPMRCDDGEDDWEAFGDALAIAFAA